jgi:phosphoglycolate phosphatase
MIAKKNEEMIKTVLFDLDGTLIDNFSALYRCYVYAAEQLQVQPVDYDTMKATVGGSLSVALAQLLGAHQAEAAAALFRKRYQEIMLEDLTVLPGVQWLLEKLSHTDLQVSVFTNKLGTSARQICKVIGLDKWLHDIIGVGDVPEHKPHPEFTKHALKRLNASSESTILIGDSKFDVETAHNSNLKCYIVTTGTHSHDEIASLNPGPDGIFRDFYALGKNVFNFSPPEVTL